MAQGPLIEERPAPYADEDSLTGRVASSPAVPAASERRSHAAWRRAARSSPPATRPTARPPTSSAPSIQKAGRPRRTRATSATLTTVDGSSTKLSSNHGRLDILVNNAGVTVDRPISTMSVNDWHNVLRVNLSGAFYMSKPALGTCSSAARGASSTSPRSSPRPATPARPTTPPPSPASSASPSPWPRGCPRTGQRRPLDGGIGLTVNAVTPGLIETDMTAAIPDKAMARILSGIPMRRIGRPDEVARVVASSPPTRCRTSPVKSGLSTAATTCDSMCAAQIGGIASIPFGGNGCRWPRSRSPRPRDRFAGVEAHASTAGRCLARIASASSTLGRPITAASTAPARCPQSLRVDRVRGRPMIPAHAASRCEG